MSVTFDGREISADEVLQAINEAFCELDKIRKGNEFKTRDPDLAKIYGLMELAGIFTLTHTNVGFEAYAMLPYGDEVRRSFTDPVYHSVVARVGRSNKNVTLEGMCKLVVEVANQI